MNKLLSFLFALLCATTIWAKPNLSGSGTQADPYLIGSLNDWRELVIYVYGGNSSYDEYFKMTADIGPFNSLDYIIGDEYNSFRGVFDGDGHTLTMDYHSDIFGYIAPFFKITDATIKNLHVTGEVTVAEPYAGGLVMEAYDELAECNTIENCRVSTKIVCNASTSGECMIGGFVGSNPDWELNITGCVFDGQIIAPNLTGCAGFVGWNNTNENGIVNIKDCVFAPTAVNVQGGKTFVRSERYDEDYVTISNCYYDLGDLQSPLGDDQGKKAHTITGNDGVTVAMAGNPKEYNLSKITSYSGNAGLKYNDNLYAGSGDVVSLNLSGSGYAYTSSAGKLSGVANPFTLTMEDADAVVSATQVGDVIIVSTESELRTAVQTDNANIQLGGDIKLISLIEITGNRTIAINMDGHTLDRGLTKRGNAGQVFAVRQGATLNLSNGTLTGGWGGDSGGIDNYGTANLTDVTITGCTGDDRGGAICNKGTLTMTGGTLSSNTSNDRIAPEGGGALFNAEGATATLTGVTITGNEAKVKGGGALCNYGTMTLDGCTITGNSCKMNGGGIWTAATATLNMQGAMTVTGNTAANSVTNNVFLKTGAVITVIGSLTGSSIGISMEAGGKFTNGCGNYHTFAEFSDLFTIDNSAVYRMAVEDEEAQLAIDYIERCWDPAKKTVVNKTKSLYTTIGYNDVPSYESEYKQVKNVNGWFALGGYTGSGYINIPEYYVVYGDVSTTTLNVLGKEVHLILCNGAKLTLSGGILCYGNKKLYIHCQSYDDSMGKLVAKSGYGDYAAGIGSNCPDTGNEDRTPGDLEIHGGDIYAKGGKWAAGIGGGYEQNGGRITILGGKIEAHGSDDLGAGIGSGYYGKGGTILIFDGTIEARGGANAAGIGGGQYSNGGTIIIHGGDVRAYGGDDAAGIGGGWDGNGGSVTINGGNVYAKGNGNGAGIGSGSESPAHGGVHGGSLTVTGGHVEAYGGTDAAGIGGGEDADGGTITISGGYVYAEGKDYGSGIGGGQGGDGGNVTITGGTVIAKAGRNEDGGLAIGQGEDGDEYGSLTLGDDRCVCITSNLWRSKKENRISDCKTATYVQISECLHGEATVSVVNGEKHDMSNCKWCYVTGEEAHTFGDDGQCAACKLIRLDDEGDNSALFTKWADGDAHDFFLSGRKLTVNSQIGLATRLARPRNSEMVESSKAYTVCLPFDMDLTDRADDVTLWTLSYIKDGSEMVFTRVLENKVEAGKPYLIVIHKGELELLGHSPLTVTADDGVRVYDWDNREQPLGWWRGTLTKIESADAAEMMAYALQSVGDFRRIRPDTYWAWWGAFRSMYCPDELPGTNRFTINRGALGGFGNTIVFEGDTEIDDDVVGITTTNYTNYTNSAAWYTLNGVRLDGLPMKKGLYIHRKRKVVVNE